MTSSASSLWITHRSRTPTSANSLRGPLPFERSTTRLLFASSNIIKIPAFATLGYMTADNLLVGAALIPVAVATNYAGIWLVRRTPVELFFRIAYVLMFLIAIELIRGSVIELWWH